VEILTRLDEKLGQGVGLTSAWNDKFRMPGWENDSVGFHADNGGIFIGSGMCTY
jgi:hypothetical protein